MTACFRFAVLLFVLSVVASPGCVQDKPPGAAPLATQATEPLRLGSLTIRSEKDNRGPWFIHAKVVETGAGAVVGLSCRVESYTLADGNTQEGGGEWRPGDPEELSYGKSSLKVTGFRAEVPRHPRQPYASAKLRLRAAVAERIELLTIPDFQLNREFRVSGHGYTVTVKGKEGLALGRDPATFIESDLQLPPDFQKIGEAEVFVLPCRFGFLEEDGTLITASGSGGDGLMYLGRNWAGRKLALEVPVGIRLMETVVEVDLPWKQAEPPRNEVSFSATKARPDLQLENEPPTVNPFATLGPRTRHQIDWTLSGPGMLVGLTATASLPGAERLTAVSGSAFNQLQVGPIMLDLPVGKTSPEKVLLTYTAVVADGAETFAFDNIRPDQKRSEKKQQTIERKHFRPLEMPLAHVDVATQAVDGRLRVELAVCRYTDDVVTIEPRIVNWRVVLVGSTGKTHEPKAANAPYALSGGPDTYMFRAGQQVVEFTEGWQDGNGRLEVILPTKFNLFRGEADLLVQRVPPTTPTEGKP